MPVDWPDHQSRPVPIDSRSLHQKNLAVPVSPGIQLGPYEMAGYNSVTVTLWDGGLFPILAKGQWDFFDSPTANSQTEQRETITVATDPKHILWQNQGTLFWLTLIGVGGATTADVYIARSNQVPFRSKDTFLWLENTGGTVIPGTFANTTVGWDTPGSSGNPRPEEWGFTTVAGIITEAHALVPGTYLCTVMGDWGGVAGVYRKVVNLQAFNSSVTLVQNSPALELTDTTEQDFNLSTILFVPSGQNTVAGNTIRLVAAQNSGGNVPCGDGRLIIWRLSANSPFPQQA